LAAPHVFAVQLLTFFLRAPPNRLAERSPRGQSERRLGRPRPLRAELRAMGNSGASGTGCCNCENSGGQNAEVVQAEPRRGAGKEAAAEAPKEESVKQMDTPQSQTDMPQTPRTARTAREAFETLSETSSQSPKKKQHIQAYTREWIKEMLQGVEVHLLTTGTETQEPYRTKAMSSLDTTVKTFHIKSEGGNILCPLASIIDVVQIEDGHPAFPEKVLGALKNEEPDRTLVVRYRQEDGSPKGFIMLLDSVDTRHRFYKCLKILHMHAAKSSDPASTPLGTPRGSPRGGATPVGSPRSSGSDAIADP